MILKIVLVLLLFIIFYHLGRALFAMIKGDSQKPMSYYLGWRVGLCVAIIVLLLIAYATGNMRFNQSPFISLI